MKPEWITLLVSSTLAVAGSATALAQARYADDYSFRVGRAADWNISAPDGQCRLRIWVDDKAQVQMRGDQIIVRTETGERSFDQGSVCTQPLPFHRVDDFRVTAERGRGAVFDVEPPRRRNNFTGSVHIDDPQNGGETYELLVAWHNPEARRVAPLAAVDPIPFFDETRAEAWARNRFESRPMTYECVLNERTNRVVTAGYEVHPRGRYSALQ